MDIIILETRYDLQVSGSCKRFILQIKYKPLRNSANLEFWIMKL